MLNNLDLTNILFLDIETVSGHATFAELDPTWRELWRLKCRSILRKYDEPITDEEAASAYDEKAGIYAEFGKIVCISVGLLYRDAQSKELKVRLKSFASIDEKELLEEFSNLMSQYYNSPNKHGISGHNIREFDVPYICRRLLVNGLPLPNLLNIAGKKPWETKYFVDTLELWRFGDYKNYTSLKLMAAVLGFPSPKDDIDGSEVGRVYWEENDLERIAVYCEKDVLAGIQLLLRYLLQPILTDEQVTFVDRE